MFTDNQPNSDEELSCGNYTIALSYNKTVFEATNQAKARSS